MNELERLIAAARPTGPGEELDSRVRQTLVEVVGHRPPAGERGPRMSPALAIAASALVAAAIGFFVGRATAETDGAKRSPAIAAQPVDGGEMGPHRERRLTTLPLPEDRLAGLFVHAGSQEGLLGVGPVTIQISKTP